MRSTQRHVKVFISLQKQSPSRGGGKKSSATAGDLVAPIPAALFCLGACVQEVHGSQPLQGSSKDWERAVMSL